MVVVSKPSVNDPDPCITVFLHLEPYSGYIYRLCPANESLTEECFMKTTLEWATDTHVLRFADASKDVDISAKDVTQGGGIGWRLNPFPNVRSDPCDYNVTLHDGPGHHCPLTCPGCVAPLYAADASCPDVCSKHYPGTPDGRKPTLPFPNPAPADTHDFSVEDTVKVPTNIAAGEYVLGWRWGEFGCSKLHCRPSHVRFVFCCPDCEHSSQVWNTCADITIA
jgi:hypothetical protein